MFSFIGMQMTLNCIVNSDVAWGGGGGGGGGGGLRLQHNVYTKMVTDWCVTDAAA